MPAVTLPALKDLRAVIFDRDGTLNASGPQDNGGYILDAAQLAFLPGVVAGLRLLHFKHIDLYVFTQQNCVTKGLISESGVDAIHHEMNVRLAPAIIRGFYFNTQAHAAKDWSKPAPGMLKAIMKANEGYHAANTLVVGDAVRDFEAAQAAGLPFAFVESDQPDKTAEARKTGLPVFGNILSMIDALR